MSRCGGGGDCRGGGGAACIALHSTGGRDRFALLSFWGSQASHGDRGGQ